MLTMGRPFAPSKLPLPIEGSGPHLIQWFPGLTRVLNPNGISISSVVLAGLTSVTDRQTDRQTDRPTDHATWSVAMGRIYVRSTAMRPENAYIDSKPSITLISKRRENVPDWGLYS